jgi:hypothetical protein
MKGADSKVGQFAAELLVQWVEGGQKDDDVDRFLVLNTPKILDLNAFQKRIRDVRARRLHRVELRACNTGTDLKTLELLRDLFNCAVLSAPRQLDGYAQINPGTPTSSATAWSSFRKAHKTRVEEGASPHRFAVAKEKIGTTLRFHAITESGTAFKNFVDLHFTTPSVPVGSAITGHALIPMGNPIFPKDRSYRDNLVVVDGLKSPF